MSTACPDTLLLPIQLIAMDVDGVLTDGSIGWSADARGELSELKCFDVQDGLGLSLVHCAGLQTAWITGRKSPLVARRAAELQVSHLVQGARDKGRVLTDLAAQLVLPHYAVLYIGDDLNDLPAFEVAGVRVAVANAAEEVRARADWTTRRSGGRGAVREVIERVLTVQGRKHAAVEQFLDRLRTEQDSESGLLALPEGGSAGQ